MLRLAASVDRLSAHVDRGSSPRRFPNRARLRRGHVGPERAADLIAPRAWRPGTAAFPNRFSWVAWARALIRRTRRRGRSGFTSLQGRLRRLRIALFDVYQASPPEHNRRLNARDRRDRDTQSQDFVVLGSPRFAAVSALCTTHNREVDGSNPCGATQRKPRSGGVFSCPRSFAIRADCRLGAEPGVVGARSRGSGPRGAASDRGT